MSLDNNPNVEQAGELASEVGSVIADRNGTHGDPVENHDHIANLWTAYLGDVLQRPIRGDEVADMMILLKLSRKHVGGMDMDHYRDAIGYAAIGSLYVPDEDETAEYVRVPEAPPEFEEAYQDLRAGGN
ncbi:hypothetical protein HRTV-25_gp52 [Halorubrum tailed virus 25]|uniref:DUF6378 domain-containing protein n=1 Tax=Halorubrum tailed virus 25 TaxID=2878006 RepID=A0AAE8Y136_9CAUD|nr:hypothetical protein M1M37_gp052 [Halorubrum tailed virus 25]UBF22633.1 hypothetical protein HRTV-25_gp52 [Halorubrum tailed virus 25]